MKYLISLLLITLFSYGSLLGNDSTSTQTEDLISENYQSDGGENQDLIPEKKVVYKAPDHLVFDNVDLKNNTIALYQNFPEPFEQFTSIEFKIAKSGNVTLEILDQEGNQVKALINEHLQPGSYLVEWDSKSLKPGSYFYRLKTGSISLIRRMTIL